MQITTRGLIIRVKNCEDDRLLTVLTEDCGVVSAVARNANKPRAKLTSSTELFCYSRLTLFRYRDSITVDSAEEEASFFGLRSDLAALALASYIAELCCELAPREEAAPEYLRLALNTLHLLGSKKKSAAFVKPVFELRLLTMAGYMPDLTGCAVCDAFEGEMRFSISRGELTCANCPQDMSAVALMPGVLAAMRHILYSESERLFSFTLSEEGVRALGEICERYLLYHLQRGFHSLEFYHSVAAM